MGIDDTFKKIPITVFAEIMHIPRQTIGDGNPLSPAAYQLRLSPGYRGRRPEVLDEIETEI